MKTFRGRFHFPACALVLCLGGRLEAQAPRPSYIAYEVPAGLPGNQDYPGALGLDFDVDADIRITRLGVFDSGSDGLTRPIEGRLYDRNTTDVALASLSFTADSPGDLIGGSRFKTLETPVDLAAGFQGTIVAAGYGAGELNGNQHGVPGALPLETNDGACSISFVGGGRFGNDPALFPGTQDGGPVNRYVAGTFMFERTDDPPTPVGAIVYQAPEGTLGNQDTGGIPLGMDFRVNSAIKVTRLGVFDSGSDGLLLSLTARVFDRPSQAPLVSLEFTPESPGDLQFGHRFKPLEPPLSLPPGFKGTIVAEGFGALEMNGNQGVGLIDGLTTDNGGCAISLKGGGRFGNTPGLFPASGDGGPPNRYAAGTFEFVPDPNPPVPLPDIPTRLTALPGDHTVDLSWGASTGTTPAATYKVLRAADQAGPFTQIAQVPDTRYTDTGLPNDVSVCYLVRAVAADGKESFDSVKKCATPVSPLPAGLSVAYTVPSGVVGNQNYTGQLGMDFNVVADIRVLRFGVFDSGSDGLTLPLSARLFERETMTELAVVDFTPEDPGLLIGGSRFKVLGAPIDLAAGFQGTMAASGYGAGEPNGNQGVGPLVGLVTDDGGCRVEFVGGGRFGNDPASYPTSPDGGPANRYASGTFVFEAKGATLNPFPTPPTGLRAEADGDAIALYFSAPIVTDCHLAAASYKVSRSVDGGPFVEIGQPASAGFLDAAPPAGADLCYRVRSVAAGGLESADTPPACAEVRRYVAYDVPGGTKGTATDGQIIGVDFDVRLDIRVHRLGVFDSGGDGLVTPLTVRLFNRLTEEEVDSLEFTPGQPGVLLGGSRFKDLPAPLDLEGGFQGSIVVEGYTLEEPYGSGGPWSTQEGACSIGFVGRGRTGIDLGAFPIGVGTGRPDQYAAGTFQFEAREFGTPRGAIAYQVPAGTQGNQDFNGQLGLDFDVNVDIRITRLGVFDSGSDAILLQPITARVYDRNTRVEMAKLEFPLEDIGELEEGSLFKDLDPPLKLPAGFQGTMAASGYGALERNGNQGVGPLEGLVTDDGVCAISFVGGGRFGADPASFPTSLDGGPANRYAAGTFEFELDAVKFRRGDADSNQTLELTDPVVVLAYLFTGGPAPLCLDAADADDNGVVEITDAILTLGYQFLGTAPPLPPGPVTCGDDPTPDGLAACTAGC